MHNLELFWRRKNARKRKKLRLRSKERKKGCRERSFKWPEVRGRSG